MIRRRLAIGVSGLALGVAVFAAAFAAGKATVDSPPAPDVQVGQPLPTIPSLGRAPAIPDLRPQPQTLIVG
jgi:hypothetical protein